MGNSNTKESRSNEPSAGPSDGRGESSRSRSRMSRSDFGGFLSLQSSSRDRDRDSQNTPLERRETRQEREARRLERDRAARAKERECSMRQEHVDGGFLVTLGTYTGIEDFSKPVVRQLQIERKLAPFWRGLNDWSPSWTEHQLVAAARGLPVPAPDAPPDPDLVPQPRPPEGGSNQNCNTLTVPLGPRTMSAASDRSESAVGPDLPPPANTGLPRSASFKPRAKALAAALSVGSRNASTTELAAKEVLLPHDHFVNGQPIEVFLYKEAAECPICFLSYPPYLNRTRCCDQVICSECFVQIRRAEPHLPEHHPDDQARDANQGLPAEEPPERLISEPSTCPYCQQPEFGVTFEPPPFRRGLIYANDPAFVSPTAMSSQSSINSTPPPMSPQPPVRRRTHSLSATATNVITTDRVRPDWATKLATARAHQARRAAAATALHTAAFLMGGNEQRSSILRPARFGRRNTGSRGTNTPGRELGGNRDAEGSEAGEGDSLSHRHMTGQRRSRMEELEEMMFMEAVRLSLAMEEERKRKEEKVLRKEAKKREQAERKAQKKQVKDPYGGEASGASASSLSLGLGGRKRGGSAASNLRMEATVSGASQSPQDDGQSSTGQQERDEQTCGKGKAVDRGSSEAQASATSLAGSLHMGLGTPRSRSHLRQMSNASSMGSSPGDGPVGSYSGSAFTGLEGNTGRRSPRIDDGDTETSSEPLFNFRSLAELVGVQIDGGAATAAAGAEGGAAPSQKEKEAASSGRPLSQVKEEDKERDEEDVEDGEAQGTEDHNGPAAATEAAATEAAATETAREGDGGVDTVGSSEVVMTAETPPVMAAPATELEPAGH